MGVSMSFRTRPQQPTVKTGIIENATLTLDLPLLVRSMSQVRAEGGSPRCVPSP